MKMYVIFLSILAVGSALTDKELMNSHYMKCSIESKGASLPGNDWVDIKDACVDSARKQIRMEFEAALAYLQVGSYFSQYDVNRPGYAKFFFDAASEERQHAIKVFDYLLMRGEMTSYHHDPNLHSLLEGSSVNKSSELAKLSDSLKNKEIKGGLDAFNLALKFEMAVTKSIKNLIVVCESESNLSKDETKANSAVEGSVSGNDYHMVDWLITDLLDEQLKGQRELAGRISTLYKMKDNFGELADFLYDKKLLEELEGKAA